ncbi:hypothetical protein [Nesterenkonia flava]|uniref:Uncharacterized protein n=1 Tax=Nesterenkonia flava TaxID=469799 RepID=A0ABU1FSU0_9MICC|nr:hypothetical protein [Nesterenkonia flava]MDR5711392.1 hypothetical protein [Nesterenkonia flava]
MSPLYPAKNPPEDLRPYLVAAVSATEPTSAQAVQDGNMIDYLIRLNIDRANPELPDQRFLQGLPLRLVPEANTVTTAWLDLQQVRVVFGRNGAASIAGLNLRDGWQLQFTLRALRRYT